MRPSLSALLTLLLTARAATAQTGSQPNLVLTIFAGVATGNNLWEVPRQPLCVLSGTSCSSLIDTLRLSRDLSSSLMAGAAATYFSSANVGFTFEVFYLGLPLDDSCTGLFYNTDAEARNQQLCDNIAAATPSTSAIAFFGGVILRTSATRAISPYVRGGVGVLSYSTGTAELSGLFVSGNAIRSRAVIVDDNPKKGAVAPQVAAGITARLGPGYQFRFELRDLLVPLQRVTGPADDLARAPIETRVHHRIALTLGLDVVLERKRGRRY